MTDMKHTKEPWAWSGETALFGLAGEQIIDYADYEGMWFSRYDDAKDQANRDRIVACVNALAGIEDPEAFMRDVRIAVLDPSVRAGLEALGRIEGILKGIAK